MKSRAFVLAITLALTLSAGLALSAAAQGVPRRAPTGTSGATNGKQPSYYNQDGPIRGQPTAEPRVASIRVRVPAGAELWIAGIKTRQKGVVRNFVTGDLDPERVYTWLVRSRWVEDGFTVEKSLNVKTFAGNRVTINFVRPPAAPAPVAVSAPVEAPSSGYSSTTERAPWRMTAPWP